MGEQVPFEGDNLSPVKSAEHWTNVESYVGLRDFMDVGCLTTKNEFKILFKFLDGRVLDMDDFDAECDLTAEQNQKIETAFQDTFEM